MAELLVVTKTPVSLSLRERERVYTLVIFVHKPQACLCGVLAVWWEIRVHVCIGNEIFKPLV